MVDMEPTSLTWNLSDCHAILDVMVPWLSWNLMVVMEPWLSWNLGCHGTLIVMKPDSCHKT